MYLCSMEIWDAKGNKVLDSVVTQSAEHVEELMQADYVSLQWVSNVKRVLPSGAYIVPFDDGVRYMLLDPHTPDQKNTDEFTYSPQFQHPKMYLGKVPYTRASKDTEGNDIKLLDWDYKGYLTTFLSDLCDFITRTFTDEGITSDKFSYSILGEIEGNVTISISNNDILSVLNNLCNTLDCEWHIDWEQRRLFVGNVRFDKNEGETLVLTSGVNVGMASVSSQTGTYYNVYLPQGSTRNMAAATSDGSYYATNRRLELDPKKYPDGMIYTDGEGNIVTKEQFLETGLPKMVQTLVLDEIYPKIDLYAYNIRSRERYLLDDNEEKVIDHYDGETPVYKRYAIWYMRLAYPIYNADGTIRSWKDATLGDTFKLISGYTPMCSFGANANGTLTSPLAGREFELNYVETVNEARELSAKADPDEGDTGVTVKKGDFEIIYTTEGNLIIPTTEEQGLVPKGEDYQSVNGNKVVIFNVVMGEDFIKAARGDLEVAALREIKKQHSDLNQYTFNSDNVSFKKDMPSLYIGRSVTYNDGVGNTLDTRIMKLTTKLDFPFMVEITVGNKVLKGSTSQLKTDVQMILSGNHQTASNEITESVVRSLIRAFGAANFLSKVLPDTARGIITFLQGTNWGSFTSETGAAMTVDPTTGQTYMEVDRLKVRLKAFFEQLEIQKVGYVGGKLIVTKGQGVDILDVENIYDTEGNVSAYRCYFLGEQEGRKIDNLLRVKDQMICKDFNVSEGSTDGATNKYYWRLATAVSSDVVKRGNNVCHWVDLSATDCDTNSDIPEIGDTICHLGNREDTDRQGAEILSVVDANSPSFTIYSGINSYSLVNKEYIDMGVVNGKAYCNIYGSTYIGDRERKSGYLRWNDDKKTFEIKGTIDITSPLSSGGTIGGAIDNAANAYKGEFDAFTSNVNEVIGGFQAQIDGVIETWFYEPEPTLGNEPAVNWTDNATKDKHLGDLYYSGEGLAYRFQKEGDNYVWKRIDDTAITKALAEAKAANDAANAAQGTADSKMRVFVVQPTAEDEYSVGDMWVNATYPADGTQYKNDILRCKTPKSKGTAFSINHWEKASKYTDDTVAKEAKKAADDANASITTLGNKVSGIYDLTDEAFKDRVIDKTERDSLQKVLADLVQDWADVASSYSKLTENSLYDSIAADVRTNFKSAYVKLEATYKSFKTAVENVISATQVTDTLINGLYNNYENFKTDYAAYVSIMTVVTKQIDAILNKSVSDLVTELGGYKYLKKATAENNTLIEGGLILSTLIGLGYTDTNKLFHVMSGMSGIYDTQKTGNGIAFWAGGSMVDKQNDASDNPAQFLVRHDGTGYAAGGNLWWEKNGKVHADPMSFIINEDNLGNLLGLFKPIYSGGSEYENITGIEPLFQFTKLRVEGGNIVNGELIGGLQIGDTAKFYIKDGVLFLEGDLAVTGGITMYASDGVTSGLLDQVYAILDSSKFEIENGVITIKGDIGGGTVKGATLGGVAVTLNANGILEYDAYPTTLPASDVYAWAKAANKPTYSWGEITDKPTLSISGGVITIGTNSITPLTAHQTVTLASGTNNGTLKLTVGSTTTDNIAVKGLGSAAFTASSAYAAASHTHSQYLVASSLDGYINALTDNTSTNVFVTAIAKSGKTLSYTKSFTKKSLTAASHSGWSSADTDKLIIPDMSFIAYWNGAYNASGNSNLLYCAKGAFGDMATASKSSYYTKTEVNTKLTDGSVTKVGTANVGATNIPIYLKAGVPTAVTLVDTANNLINNLTTGTSTPEDADYYVAQYVGGGTTTITFHRRPHSALYAYIKGKAEGTWAISVSGNAATATTLQTARTLWGQSFNGSANISGNMSGVGQITFSALSGTNGRALLYQQMADNDYFRIYCGGTGNNGGYAEIATADDGTEPIYVRQYSGVFGTLVRTLTLLDGNGNTTVPGLLTAANGTFNSTLKVGAIPVTNSSTGVLKIDGSLIVTGGITMYATDGVASGLMEQILVDGTTIGKKADGTLYAINTGNVRSIIMGSTTYTPNDSGAVTLPEKVTWANIEGKPSSFTPSSHTHSSITIPVCSSLNGNSDVFSVEYAGGNNSVATKPSGVDAFGVMRLRTAAGWYGQIMMSANTAPGMYYRNANGLSSSVGWKKLLDSGNFEDYAAAKSHTHAISQITNLQATLDGKAAASHTHSYLPLAGGTLTGALTIDFNHSGGGTTSSLLNVLFNGTHDYGVVAKFHSYGGDSPAIRFSHSSNKSEYNSQVNTNWSVGMRASTYTDFAITQDRGTSGWGTVRFAINNSGNVGIGVGSASYKLHVAGDIYTTTGFKKNGSSDSYVLLGGGGHKLISDFATSSHTHSYLPLSGGTMTGDINLHDEVAVIWSPIFSSYMRMPFRIEDNGYFTGINLYNSNHNVFTKIGIFTDKYGQGNDINSIFLYPNAAPKIGTNIIWHAGNDGSGSGLDADTCDGLHVHGGRNYEANKIVRTDGNGYIQCGYINSSYGDEGNNSSPARVWGTNGSDSYMRTYLTSALSVNYAASAGNADTLDGYHYSSFAWASHTHSYLPLSGGTLTNSETLLLQLNSTSNFQSALLLALSNSVKSQFGFVVNVGTFIYDYTNSTFIGVYAYPFFQSNDGKFRILTENYIRNTNNLASDSVVFKGVNDGEYFRVLDIGIGITDKNITTTIIIDNQGTYGKIYHNGGHLCIQEQYYVGIGTTSPSEKLHVAGNILASGGITMYSDLRKKNILSNEVLSVKEIAAAPLFKHTYKSDDNQYIHVGTSAQYWSGIHDNWFTRKDSEGYYQMELQNLGVAMGISLAREVIKYESKTDKKIRLMKKRINELEKANESLEARVKELEERRSA